MRGLSPNPSRPKVPYLLTCHLGPTPASRSSYDRDTTSWTLRRGKQVLLYSFARSPELSSHFRATLILDAHDQVIGWRAGALGGPENAERWGQMNLSLTSAVEDLAGKMSLRSAASSGVPRGEHAWAHWGYSYGGGEQVGSFLCCFSV